MKRGAASILLLVIAAACSGDGAGPTITTVTPSVAPAVTQASTTTIASTTPATAPPRSVDLTDRPLIWFGPLPPLPTDAGRPFTGADDFFELFDSEAEWETASGQVDVFLLYAEWVAHHATVAELERILEDLDRRGIAVAVEGSPLTRTDECGTNAESWGGIPEGRRVADKVIAADGVIDLWAMDAPLAYAHLVDYSGTCQWEPSRVAEEIAAFRDAMQGYFPDLVVGDTEPLWSDLPTSLYVDWLVTYEQVVGETLPFFHLDVDWGRPGWAEDAAALAGEVTASGSDFGIFYTGNRSDDTDRAWVQLAGERAVEFEGVAGDHPAHVLFQSWYDHPDRSLPDSDPTTFTGLITTYVDDPSALGVLTEGPGANAAFGAEVTASRALEGFPPEAAVDGDSETWWGAGDFAPQWLELELAAPIDVAEVSLVVGQSPDGPTRHRLLAGPEPGALVLVHEFAGVTSDLQRLVFRPETPLPGIRVVRIETQDTTSWVSWREIEVIVAG